MKKSKKIICLTLLFTLLLGVYPSTVTLASESIQKVNTKARNIILDVWRAPIRSGTAYISKSFIPKQQRTSYIYQAEGTNGNQSHYYKFYMQKKETNGYWTTVATETIQSGSSLVSTYLLIPNNEYRVKVETNDKYARNVTIEIYEYDN